jgi:hypothetical protein
MCVFDAEFNQALKGLVEKGESFDMLDLVDEIRKLTTKSVEYIKRVNGQIVAGESVKFLALTAFEDGKVPHYVLDVKELQPTTDSFGQTVPPPRKTVWVFRPIRYTPTRKWAVLG